MVETDKQELKVKPAITQPMTKLMMPDISVNYLKRPRLNKRFQKAIKHKVILVTAPSGYGKTTFLSEVLSNADYPVAWISLDKKDDDIYRFWNNIILAIQKIQPSLGDETLAILQNNEQSVETAITELINKMVDAPDLYIVIDDYHYIESKAIHNSLEYLMNWLPPSIHLIISTRVEPPLSLNRMRCQGHLVEFKTADLKFTIEETTEFLHEVLDSPLSPKDVQYIYSKTEGWIAGLQMVVVTMQGNSDVNSLLAAFSGSNKEILEYLTNEILNQQNEENRKFLLETSIFDRFTVEMCNEILERRDSRHIINDLTAKNLFLQAIDHEETWFRYHSLFREALQKQLVGRLDVVLLLHSRASIWFEREGLIEEAIEHALEAKEFDRAIELFDKIVRNIVGQDKYRLVLNWAEKMPERFVAKSLWTNIACALACEATRQPEYEEIFTQVALSITENVPAITSENTLDSAHLWGSIYFLRSFDAYNKGRLRQAIKHSEEGLESLPPNEMRARCGLNTVKAFALWKDGELVNCHDCCTEAVRLAKVVGWHYSTSLALSGVAHIQFALGHLNSSAATCHEVMGILQQNNEISGSRYAYLLLAEILYQRNSLNEAEKCVLKAISLSENGQEPVIWLSCQMALARIKIARGEMDDAMEIARRGKIIFESACPSSFLADIFICRLWLMLGNESAAADCADSWANLLIPQVSRLLGEGALDSETLDNILKNGIYCNDIRNVWAETPLLILVRVGIAQGKLGGLIKVLEYVRQDGESKRWKGLVIETSMLEALVLYADGKIKLALEVLSQVLSLTEKENYLRIYVDEGQPMFQLLHRALRRGILPNYVSKIIAAFNICDSVRLDESDTTADAPSAPLTNREIEILNLISDGLSNQDIANKLYIGLSTVKNYSHRIYEKLDVNNRASAIIRAQEMGLIKQKPFNKGNTVDPLELK